MSGQEFFILADVGGVLGFVTRLYLSKVVIGWVWLTKFDRSTSGFFILRVPTIRVFVDRYPTPFLGTVFCMWEAPLALEFLTLLKRRGLIKVHYSMLDLPWSFNCGPKYKKHVRQRTKQLFGEIVSSADFVTPEMQSQFDNDYFSGPSFQFFFCPIEMVMNESPKVGATDGVAGRRNICYAGAFRASGEFQYFLDLLKRGVGGAHIDAKFDVYGPHDPTLGSTTEM